MRVLAVEFQDETEVHHRMLWSLRPPSRAQALIDNGDESSRCTCPAATEPVKRSEQYLGTVHTSSASSTTLSVGREGPLRSSDIGALQSNHQDNRSVQSNVNDFNFPYLRIDRLLIHL